MSDVMLLGILRMPQEMAMADPLSRFQFYSAAQEALTRMEKAEAAQSQAAALQVELDEAKAQLASMLAMVK
jgi:hypothetical protein